MGYVSYKLKLECITYGVVSSWERKDSALVSRGAQRSWKHFLTSCFSSSSIIEHLTVYCQNTPESALAYFYFDFNDAGKRDINSLLKSLISQLAAQKQDMPPPLLELFENHQRGAVDKAAEIENDVLLETFRNLVR